MTSLRTIANCISITGEISIIRDFFGYKSGVYGHMSFEDVAAKGVDGVAIDPNAPGRLSLLQQVDLLKGPHINLDLIRVGIEDFTTVREQELDVAVQITRELYARIGLGVGRVLRFSIKKADARGLTVIETEDDVYELIDNFSAPGGGMDVFFVKDIELRADGETPVKDPEGTVVSLTGSTTTGIALAHELGHYLGLDHVSLSTNLMSENTFPKLPFDLTSEQVSDMKSSEHVAEGCS